MAQPSAYEQYLLELINRGRLAPAAEALRYDNDLNEGLAPGTISTAAKQPLAFNLDLIDAARGHSQWMLDADVFSHTGLGGSNPGDRMRDAGYAFGGAWTWGENIAWAGTTGTPDPTAYVAMEHKNLFLSEHHRENTMNDDFQEIGLGVLQGVFSYDGTDFNTVMTTENFAKSGNQQFLTGVAYVDGDGDAFYTPGEGLSGVAFTARAGDGTLYSTTTMAAGGHQQVLPAGPYTVTISGGALPDALDLELPVAGQNVKLDLIGTTHVASSASVVLGAHVTDLTLLGTDRLSGTGNALANAITGTAGANALRGEAGNDVLAGVAGDDKAFGGVGDDHLVGGAGRDRLHGGDGNDRLVGGPGADVLAGGGGADVFEYTDLADASRSRGLERVVDFECGVDKFDVGAVNMAAGWMSASLAAADGISDVVGALGAVGAHAMGVVEVASGRMAGTYLYINDGAAAFDAASDALIDLTGITGTLSLSDFV